MTAKYEDSYCGSTRIAYENLANQIVARAAQDYKLCVEKLQSIEKRGNKDGIAAANCKVEIKSIRRFIFSEWFKVLTNANPEIIWKHIAVKSVERKLLKEEQKNAEKKARKNQSNRAKGKVNYI